MAALTLKADARWQNRIQISKNTSQQIGKVKATAEGKEASVLEVCWRYYPSDIRTPCCQSVLAIGTPPNPKACTHPTTFDLGTACLQRFEQP